MDFLVQYDAEARQRSPQGTADYIAEHLESVAEAGELRRYEGYLSREGKVKPIAFNPELWKAVGWDPEVEEQPPAELLRQLTKGCDLAGNKLTRGKSLFRPMKEVLITVPCELSEATKGDPVAAMDIIMAGAKAVLAEAEKVAIRARSGRGKRGWLSGKILTLLYPHGENREGEPHIHPHIMIFPPAWLPGEGWRAWDNGAHVASMSKPGGTREVATQAMIEAAARHGYQVDIRRGTAAEAPGEVQGATVTCPDGKVIRAGSITHQRRSEILAAKEMKLELGGVTPLTPRELELFRRESGKKTFRQKLQDLPQDKRYQAIACKLVQLGMLGEDGKIPSEKALTAAFQAYERNLAAAQVKLEAGRTLPGDGKASGVAAGLVLARRKQVKELLGSEEDLQASEKAARLRWTQDYTRILLLVHQSGLTGLTTESLTKHDRDLLSKLKRVGHLLGEKDHGRITYTLSQLGTSKLQELLAERGALVAGLLPGIRAELQLASGAGPGAVSGGREGAGGEAGASPLPAGAPVPRGPDGSGSPCELPGGLRPVARKGAGPGLPVPAGSDVVEYAGDERGSEVGSGAHARTHAVRLPSAGTAGVVAGGPVREPGRSESKSSTSADHGPELAPGRRRGMAGSAPDRDVVDSIRDGGIAEGAPGGGLHPSARDADPGCAGRTFPDLPRAARPSGPRPRALPVGFQGSAAGFGGVGAPSLSPSGPGNRQFLGPVGAWRPAAEGLAWGPGGSLEEPVGVGSRTAGPRDPRAVRSPRGVGLPAAPPAFLVRDPGVPGGGRGESLLPGCRGLLGAGIPLASPAAGGSRSWGGLDADPLRARPRSPWRPDPLQGLGLPRNLVAQGLERVRALARQVRRAGQHLGLDLLQLGRLSVALAKPVQLITDWLSPSPELVPKTDRTPTTGPTQPRPRLKK